MNYKSFVINLERRPDRLKNFISNNSDISNISEFAAIDGRNLKLNTNHDLLYNGNILLSKHIFSNFNNKLKIGEVGCFLSHYFLWKNCIKQNTNFLIFEDDAFVVKDFSKKLNSILTNPLPDDCDFLYIGLRQNNFNWDFYKKHISVNKNKLINNHYYKHKCEQFQQFYTHCYIITPKTCQYLCNYIDNEMIQNNSILALDHFLSEKLNYYICFQNDSEPILSYASSNPDSDIQSWSCKSNNKYLL